MSDVPMTGTEPTGSARVDFPQPEGERDPATGLADLEQTKTGAPTGTEGEPASMVSEGETIQKRSSVEAAGPELTGEAGDTATISQ